MSPSAHGLCEFIDASPSPFHVCLTVAQRLSAAGFTELSERDEWPGEGSFFTVRAGSLVAWRSEPADGPFRIVGAHTDSPTATPKNISHTPINIFQNSCRFMAPGPRPVPASDGSLRREQSRSRSTNTSLIPGIPSNRFPTTAMSTDLFWKAR